MLEAVVRLRHAVGENVEALVREKDGVIGRIEMTNSPSASVTLETLSQWPMAESWKLLDNCPRLVADLKKSWRWNVDIIWVVMKENVYTGLLDGELPNLQPDLGWKFGEVMEG